MNSGVFGCQGDCTSLHEKSHTQQTRLDELVAQVGIMEVQKEDVSSAAGTLSRLESALTAITSDADVKENKI